MKKITITRKIEVRIAESDKEMRDNYHDTLREWARLCRMASNLAVSQMFTLLNMSKFMCLKDDVKDVFVSDLLKKEKGNSERNVTNRLVSDLLKGKVPSAIYVELSSGIHSSFKKRTKDYVKGDASIPCFSKDNPIPITAQHIRQNFRYCDEDKKYYVNVCGIPFSLHFGRDRSNNESIVEKCLEGEYKMCSSKILLDDKKIFLLLCFEINADKNYNPVKGKVGYAYLGIDTPISLVVDCKTKRDDSKKVISIGSGDELLHRRVEIKEARRRLSRALYFNRGGHGRKAKLKKLEDFKDKERNFVDTMLHKYSNLLARIAKKYKCEKVVLVSFKESDKQEGEEKEKFILQNWSYYGLKEKIKYKLEKEGISYGEEKIEKK